MLIHILTLNWNRRRQNALIALEMGFAFLVLFMLVSVSLHFYRLFSEPLGFDTDNKWDVTFSTGGSWREPKSDGSNTRKSNSENLRDLIAILGQLPEIDGVYTVKVQPFAFKSSTSNIDNMSKKIFTEQNVVNDGFAEAISLRLLEGRWFSSQDEKLDWVPVVVNKHFRDYFSGEEVVGKEFNNMRIVGVFEDFRQHGNFSSLRPMMLVRQTQDYTSEPSIMLRVKPGVDIHFEEKLHRVLISAMPTWSFDINTWEKMRKSINKPYIVALSIATAVVAFLLILVGLGLLGVLWQNVIRRTVEVGLRRSMGATAGSIKMQLIGELLTLSAIVIIVNGIFLIQIPLTGAIKKLDWSLFGSSFPMTTLIFLGFCVLFTLYPGIQAARKQPADALHYQ